MTGAAIGLIIIVAAYSIIWIIGEILGLNILGFAESIGTLFDNTGGSSGN